MKPDEPSLRVQIEPGRMVPADPYSEEAMNVYPLGSVVTCRIGPDMTTPKRVRYRSILARAVKQFATPWKSGRAADWTMKLTLGVTEEATHLNGTKVRFPGSTTSLTDAEFERFYSGAMAILQKVIGVDPETLGRAPSKEEEQPQESAPPDSSQADAGGGGDPVASPSPDRERPLTQPAAAATATRTEPVEHEAIRKLIRLATDAALSPQERLEEIDTQQPLWLDAVGPERREFITTVFAQAARVARGELGAKSAEDYLLALAKEGGQDDGR